MCGNRVEELEARVQELEASVEGLTDELVECKVRLRELEDAVDDDLGFVPEGSAAGDEETETAGPEADPGAAEAREADNHKSEPSEEEGEETDSDIIVA